MNSVRKILVPVDQSKASETAFLWALDNLVKDGDKVHVFNVLPRKKFVVLSTGLMTDEVPPVMEEVVEDSEETMKHAEEEALKHMRAVYVPLLEARQIPYEIDVARFSAGTDHVGSVICKKADMLAASAVVMAKHNRGALKELFIGSVASYCVNQCKAPLFVVHAD